MDQNAISIRNKRMKKYLFVHSMGLYVFFLIYMHKRVVFYLESHCDKNKQGITPAAFLLCTTSLSK